MKQEGLKFFTDTHLTVVGFFIFFSYFIYVSIKAWKLSKNSVQHFSNIPLENEVENGK